MVSSISPTAEPVATEAPRPPDWDVGPIRYPWTRRMGVIVALVAPVFIFSAVLAVLGNFDLVFFPLLMVMWGLILFCQWLVIKSRLLQKVAPIPLDDPRFTNIVEGLAAERGFPSPHLFVVADGGPNAFILRRRGPAIVVRKSLLESYTRTEQEAVAAHCLVRLNSGHLKFSLLAAALGRTGSRAAPKVGFEDDVHAAALTRYPPALASAIKKAKPVEDASAVLWFVGHDPSHRHPAQRIEALQDL